MPDAEQTAPVEVAEPEVDGEALSEFLSGNDEEAPADEAAEPRMIAAD